MYVFLVWSSLMKDRWSVVSNIRYVAALLVSAWVEIIDYGFSFIRKVGNDRTAETNLGSSVFNAILQYYPINNTFHHMRM